MVSIHMTGTIVGQIPRSARIPRGDIPCWHVGDQALAGACVPRIDQPPDRRRLDRLAQPGQQRPRPRLPQQGIRYRVAMEPWRRLRLPAAARRNAMPMRIVVPRPAVGRDHDDRAALQGTATDPAADSLQAPPPTTHEGTQHRLSLLITYFSEELRHGQDAMAVEDACMEPLAPWAAPGGHRHFRAAQAQR